MEFGLLAAFVLASAALAIVPGPDMLFITAHALVGGPRTGVVAAAGMSSGLVVHTLAAAFGLGALIAAAPLALDVVRLCGAVFLAYLAITTWLASRRHDGTKVVAEQRRPLRKVYAMAVLTNIANPKVVLFYLAFLPQFVTTGAQAWPVTVQLMVLGFTLIVVGFVIDGTVGILSGTVATRLLHRRSFRQWVDRVCAAIFGALAVRMATTHL